MTKFDLWGPSSMAAKFLGIPRSRVLELPVLEKSLVMRLSAASRSRGGSCCRSWTKR